MTWGIKSEGSKLQGVYMTYYVTYYGGNLRKPGGEHYNFFEGNSVVTLEVIKLHLWVKI